MRDPSNASRDRFVLRWHSSDPDDTLRLLLDLGARVPTIHEGSSRTGLRASFPPVVIELVRAADPHRAEWLEIAPDAGVGPAPADATLPTHGGSALALGWATVDASRAARAFPEVAFRAVADEEALGARARAGRWGRIDLILLEPAAEGRLAAALARHGEGPVALYVAAPVPGGGSPPRDSQPASRSRPPRVAGREVLGPAASPVEGAVRLVRPSRPSGPFLFVVDREQRSDAA
jgi:hypothetical protein